MVKIGADATAFVKGINDTLQPVSKLDREMKVVRTNLQAATAGMDDFAKSTEGLKARAASLTTQVDLQKQKIAALDIAFQKAAEAKGLDARETQNLAIRLNKAHAELGKLESELRQTNSELEKGTRNTSAFARATAGMQTQLTAAAESSKGLLMGLGALATAVAGVGVKAVMMAGDMEQSKIAFTTMLGSAEQADAFLKQLFDFASKTPFEFKGLQDSARQLLAFGFQSEQIIPMMTAIGNAVSGLGGGQDMIERVTRALGQMQAKGKVSAEEMNQLTENGIPAWDILAKTIGVDIPTAMKMAENGAIPAGLAIEGLITGMNERFPNMMAEQSKSLLGMWSNVKDNVSGILVDIGNEIITAFDLKTKLAGVVDWLTTLSTKIKEVGVREALEQLIPPNMQATIVMVAGAIAGALVPGLISMAVAGWAAIAPLLPFMAAGAAIAGVAYLIYKNWEPIKGFFINLWNGIKTTMVNAANAVVGFFKQWGPTILAVLTGPFGLAVLYIAKHWDQIKAGLIAAWNAIKTTAITMVGNVVAAIKNVFSRIKDLASDALNWGRNIVEGLWNGIQGAIGWLKGLIAGWVGDVRTFILNLFGIKSPSKMTQEMGQQLAAGLAVGILDGTDQVLAALEQQAAAAEAQLKAANDRLAAIEAEKAQVKAENDRKELQQEINNSDAKMKLKEKDIANLRERLAELKKKGKDTASILQQIAKAEQSLTEAKQKAAEARTKLDEFETKIRVEAAQKQVDSLKEQQDALRDYQSVLKDSKKAITDYYDQMAAAAEDYQKKVAEVNAKLAADEKALAEQFEKDLSSRAKSLSDFVGLFDQVTSKEVSGAQLLDNLRGQVSAFEDWQQNISALAARGIDEGLLQELREMGPKVAPEIAALNTLTDQQLTEYVYLWQQKNRDARQEAETQLERQRVEMLQKLQEIRATAAEQLAQYKAEWEAKNAEIRKNALDELTKIDARFKEIDTASTAYGSNLIANFVAGIQSRRALLQATLEEIAGMVDSYMPHSPAKRGPLSRLAEWGPSLVKTFADGIRDALPELNLAVSGMATISAGEAPSGLAAITNNTINNSNRGPININVHGAGNPDAVANLVLRKLSLAGGRF